MTGKQVSSSCAFISALHGSFQKIQADLCASANDGGIFDGRSHQCYRTECLGLELLLEMCLEHHRLYLATLENPGFFRRQPRTCLRLHSRLKLTYLGPFGLQRCQSPDATGPFFLTQCRGAHFLGSRPSACQTSHVRRRNCLVSMACSRYWLLCTLEHPVKHRKVPMCRAVAEEFSETSKGRRSSLMRWTRFKGEKQDHGAPTCPNQSTHTYMDSL